MNVLKKAQVLHRYYKMTLFYKFLRKTLYKGGIGVAIFIGIIFILEYFFIDTRALLDQVVVNYKPIAIFIVFFTSETILGLLPPEVFIAWAGKTSEPWIYLSILATLSYIGGIISYYLGRSLLKFPSVKHHIEVKIAKHIANLKKWGGFFIIIGAMLPVPHSIVSFACGLIKFNFRHYTLWALLRFLRFLIYAFIIFKIV